MSDSAPSPKSASGPSPARKVFLIVAVAGTLGVISQLLRGTMGVIAPDMMRDLDFGPERLGLLTGVFFFAYAMMQVPMGVLLDRFGPRRVVVTFLAVAAVGSIAFAQADAYPGLVGGRVVMGVGAAAFYMGGFTLLVRWVEPERYMRLAAAMVTIANVGSLFATTPFAFVAEAIGWRGAFLVIAGIAAIVAAVMMAAVRDWPPGVAHPAGTTETVIDSFKAVLSILGDRRIQRVCVLALVTYPTIASVFVLWGGPYLHDIHGLDPVARGNVLLFMAIAIALGPIVFSWIDARIGARRTVIYGCALQTSALLGLALVHDPHIIVIDALFVVLGVSGGYNLLLPAVSRFFFADSMAARVMTTVTLFIIGGVALFQAATGFIVGAFIGPDGIPSETGYRVTFGFLALAMVAGTYFFSGITEFTIRRREP